MQADRDFSFEIKEHIGVIIQYDNGWNKELNVVSWNGNQEKYDIRDWDEGHERMTKGTTLLPVHMRRMVDLYLASQSRKAVQKTKDENLRRAENREKTPRRQFDRDDEAEETKIIIEVEFDEDSSNDPDDSNNPEPVEEAESPEDDEELDLESDEEEEGQEED